LSIVADHLSPRASLRRWRLRSQTADGSDGSSAGWAAAAAVALLLLLLLLLLWRSEVDRVSYSAAPSSGDPARTWATPAATRPVALRYFLDRPEYWVFYSPFVALANHFRGRPRGANRAADGEHTFAEERRLMDEHAATARRHCRSRELAWWLCAFQCPATSGQGAGAAAARTGSREPEQARTGSTARRSAGTTTAGSEALRARGQSQGERTPEGGA